MLATTFSSRCWPEVWTWPRMGDIAGEDEDFAVDFQFGLGTAYRVAGAELLFVRTTGFACHRRRRP